MFKEKPHHLSGTLWVNVEPFSLQKGLCKDGSDLRQMFTRSLMEYLPEQPEFRLPAAPETVFYYLSIYSLLN